MREHRLLSPHRAAFAPAKAHDGRIITDAPNVRWATDGAKIWTAEDGWVWLFDLVEHWNGECLGWHVCKIGDRFAAWEPLAQALAHTLGGLPGAARGIQLRHDHGSQSLTDYFQSNARFHGFAPSFALPGEPETNGVVERFHRTLKEQISTAAPAKTSPNSVPPSPPSSISTITTGCSKNSIANPQPKPVLLSIPPCPELPIHSYPVSNQPGAVHRSDPVHYVHS